MSKLICTAIFSIAHALVMVALYYSFGIVFIVGILGAAIGAFSYRIGELEDKENKP